MNVLLSAVVAIIVVAIILVIDYHKSKKKSARSFAKEQRPPQKQQPLKEQQPPKAQQSPNDIIKDLTATMDVYQTKIAEAYKKKYPHEKVDFDAYVLIFVLISLFSHNSKDRERIYNDLKALILDKNRDTNNEKSFDYRTVLYLRILRGEVTLRADYTLGYSDSFSPGKDEDILPILVVLFGDLVHNPNYAENYEEAPVAIRDIYEEVEYGKFILGDIMGIVLKLSEEIARILGIQKG